jgi:signal peptidase I
MTSAGLQIATGTELTAEVLLRFGSARIRVQGSSMLPTLRPGDEVELLAVPFHEAEIGDIVAYRHDERLFVHRVVEKNSQKGFLTRGDALRHVDAPVSESEFLGLVVGVIRNGEKVEQRDSVAYRAMASVFRRSRLCAALYVKFVSL